MKQLKRIAIAQKVSYREVEGGNHTKVYLGTRMISIPRHREINENTAQGILKEAWE
ncbi:MAG: hypothetical protein SPI12_06985 [Actinomycetaceae bacterium]|nr:hypothetical protein [Actinomycetaceae bacterium]MDY6083579.1 hypothetical protein [Actinomycetaceae bacterium]